MVGGRKREVTSLWSWLKLGNTEEKSEKEERKQRRGMNWSTLN